MSVAPKGNDLNRPYQNNKQYEVQREEMKRIGE